MLLNCGAGEGSFKRPLESKQIKPSNLKGNQAWVFVGRTDAEAEALILWPLDVKIKLWEMVRDREACFAAVHGVTKSRTWLGDWAAPLPPILCILLRLKFVFPDDLMMLIKHSFLRLLTIWIFFFVKCVHFCEVRFVCLSPRVRRVLCMHGQESVHGLFLNVSLKPECKSTLACLLNPLMVT